MSTARHFAIALACAAAFAGSTSQAQEAVPKSTDTMKSYGAVEGWNVYVNETRKNCFGERVRENAVLQMGGTDTMGIGYLGVFTQAPTNAKNDKIRSVAIDVNGKMYEGGAKEMAGTLKNGYSGGYIISKDPGFIQSVADQPSMKVMISDRPTVTLDLKGTKKAITMIRECDAKLAG